MGLRTDGKNEERKGNGMRIALIIPPDTPPTGGNAVSAERVKSALAKQGISAEVVWYGKSSLAGYDVFHAWNAVRVGAQLVQDGVPAERIIATWTGTDLWQDWVQDAAQWKPWLNAIAFQAVFTEDARTRILENAPEWAEKIKVIPPSVDDLFFHPHTSPLNLPHPSFLLAGGIRPVKRVTWAIDLIEKARDVCRADMHFYIAGPSREANEWNRTEQMAASRPWVHMLGEVTKQDMPDWYNGVDYIINTSSVEGVSNALMEAMASGALVVASNIAGNRFLIENHQTGLLFDNEEQFLDQLRWAQAHQDEVKTMQIAARHKALSYHSSKQEVGEYIDLYTESMQKAIKGCRS